MWINVVRRDFWLTHDVFIAFFYSWWTAVGNSAGIAADNIGQIVQIIDVPKNTDVVLQWIMIALQSVFALIPGPLGVYAAHSNFNPVWQTWAQVFSNAIAIAPNVGRFLFPTGDANSKIVQLADLSANFGKIIQQVQSNLNLTLSSVMVSLLTSEPSYRISRLILHSAMLKNSMPSPRHSRIVTYYRGHY